MVKRAAASPKNKRPAKKAATVASRQKALLAVMIPEKHSFDTAINGNHDQNNLAFALSLIDLGSTNATRTGNQIRISGIKFKLLLTLGEPSAIVDQYNYRVMIVHDKAANGSTTLVTDVLTSASINAFRNMNQVTRFDVMYDKVHTMTTVDRSSGIFDRNKHITWSSSNLNIPCLYNNTASPTGVAHQKTSAIWMYVIGLTGDATTLTSVVGTTRINFYDA